MALQRTPLAPESLSGNGLRTTAPGRNNGREGSSHCHDEPRTYAITAISATVSVFLECGPVTPLHAIVNVSSIQKSIQKTKAMYGKEVAVGFVVCTQYV